jgi:hypothetical protein
MDIKKYSEKDIINFVIITIILLIISGIVYNIFFE